MKDVSPFEQFPELATKRLRLRQLTMDDAPDILKIYGDPEVMRYSLDSPYPNITSARILIRFFAEEYKQRNLIWWGTEHLRDGAIIGTLGLWHLNFGNASAELGFDTARLYWRKGITTEAIWAVLDFGFQKLRLHRIYAKTVLENTPSMKLLEKVGFVAKGIVAAHTPPNEMRVPVQFFELNREDF